MLEHRFREKFCRFWPKNWYTNTKKKCQVHRICNKYFIAWPRIMNVGQIDISQPIFSYAGSSSCMSQLCRISGGIWAPPNLFVQFVKVIQHHPSIYTGVLMRTFRFVHTKGQGHSLT